MNPEDESGLPPQKPDTVGRKGKNKAPSVSDDPMAFHDDMPPQFKLKSNPKALEDMKALSKRKQKAGMSANTDEYHREKYVNGTCSRGTYLVVAKTTEGREKFVSMRHVGEIRVHLHPKGEYWPLRHLPITMAARRSDEGYAHDSFRLDKSKLTEFLEDLQKIPNMSVMDEGKVRELLHMEAGGQKRGGVTE